MTAAPHIPNIGIRIPVWATFTREVFSGITDYMREHSRWRLETPLETESELTSVRIDEDWKGDGLIVFRYTKEEAAAWLERGIRVVNFSSENLDPRIPTVTPDNRESGRLAAKHLIAAKYRHFAFKGDPTRVYSRERGDGFREELERAGFRCAGLEADAYGFSEATRAGKLAAELDRQLAACPRPCGVFAKDDVAAMEVVRACGRLGYAIPGDIAVVGCNDDFVFCHTADAPLSSVGYPGRKIGFTIAGILDALLTGETGLPERTLVAPDPVVTRESSDGELRHHPHVRKAIRIIREVAPLRPLQVGEILERLPYSRSALKERFVQETGETLNAMIARIRCERLCELLEIEATPLKVVSQQLGFAHYEEMPRFFRRMTGLSPTEWRARRKAEKAV